MSTNEVILAKGNLFVHKIGHSLNCVIGRRGECKGKRDWTICECKVKRDWTIS